LPAPSEERGKEKTSAVLRSAGEQEEKGGLAVKTTWTAWRIRNGVLAAAGEVVLGEKSTKKGGQNCSFQRTGDCSQILTSQA